MGFKEAITEEMKQYRHVKIAEDDYTIGAFTSAVLKIDTIAAAKEFWEGYLQHQKTVWSELNALRICQSNIGWCFGEGMSEECIQIWIQVCNASHPVFGTLIPTLEEAFKAGMHLGSERASETEEVQETEV